MKKLFALFAIVFSCTSYAALPNDVSEFAINAPIFNGNFEFGASALLLRFSTSELDYALIYPGDLFVNGRYKSVNPTFDLGYQVNIGYRFPCSSNDVRLVYSHYDESDKSHIGEPDGTIFPLATQTFNFLFPEVTGDLTFPGPVIFDDVTLLAPADVPVTFTILEADVKNTYTQRSLDLEFGQHLNIDTMVKVRWFAGLRYANINNKFDVNYIYYNASATESQTVGPFVVAESNELVTTTLTAVGVSQLQHTIFQSSDFKGIGPRIGTEGTFHLGGGLGLSASLAFAFIAGHQDCHIADQFNGTVDLIITDIDVSSTPVPGVTVSDLSPAVETVIPLGTPPVTSFGQDDQFRIVPNIDGKIGLNYSSQFCNCSIVTIELGYYVNHYFNAIDRLSIAGNTSSGLATKHTLDASFSGPYLGVQVII